MDAMILNAIEFDEMLSGFPLEERAAIIDQYVAENHIKLARTPETAKLGSHGCLGCYDGDNLRHPVDQPRRCGACPVDLKLHAKRGDLYEASVEAPNANYTVPRP